MKVENRECRSTVVGADDIKLFIFRMIALIRTEVFVWLCTGYRIGTSRTTRETEREREGETESERERGRAGRKGERAREREREREREEMRRKFSVLHSTAAWHSNE